MDEKDRTMLAFLMSALAHSPTKTFFIKAWESANNEFPNSFSQSFYKGLDRVLSALPEKLDKQVFERVSKEIGTDTDEGRALCWWTVEYFK